MVTVRVRIGVSVTVRRPVRYLAQYLATMPAGQGGFLSSVRVRVRVRVRVSNTNRCTGMVKDIVAANDI